MTKALEKLSKKSIFALLKKFYNRLSGDKENLNKRRKEAKKKQLFIKIFAHRLDVVNDKL